MEAVGDINLLTIAEAAVLLGKDRSAVLRDVQRGRIHPVAKLPGHTGSWLLSREQVEGLRRQQKGE